MEIAAIFLDLPFLKKTRETRIDKTAKSFRDSSKFIKYDSLRAALAQIVETLCIFHNCAYVVAGVFVIPAIYSPTDLPDPLEYTVLSFYNNFPPYVLFVNSQKYNSLFCSSVNRTNIYDHDSILILFHQISEDRYHFHPAPWGQIAAEDGVVHWPAKALAHRGPPAWPCPFRTPQA